MYMNKSKNTSTVVVGNVLAGLTAVNSNCPVAAPVWG